MWIFPQFRKSQKLETPDPSIVVSISVLIQGNDNDNKKVSKILEKRYSLKMKNLIPGVIVDKINGYNLVINKVIKIRELNKPSQYKIRAWFVKESEVEPVKFGEDEFKNIVSKLNDRGWWNYVP